MMFTKPRRHGRARTACAANSAIGGGPRSVRSVCPARSSPAGVGRTACHPS
jgi:hypothetical protein